MLRNGIYNIANRVIVVGVATLSTPILVRALNIEDYGVWILLTTVIGISAIADAGISSASTIFIGRDIAKSQPISGILILTIIITAFLSTTITLLLFNFAPSIIRVVSSLEGERYGLAVKSLKIGSFVVWGKLFQQVLMGVLQAFEKYSLLNAINSAHSVIGGIMICLIALKGGNLIALMIGTLVLQIISLLGFFIVGWLLVRRVGIEIYCDKKKAKEMLVYSFWSWTSTIGVLIYGQLDKLVIGRLLGIKILGVYSVIISIVSQVNVLTSSLVQPLLQIINKSLITRSTNEAALQSILKDGQQAVALIALGIGGMLFTMAGNVLAFFLGLETSLTYATPFRIAVIIYSICALNPVGYFILFSMDSVKDFVRIQMIGAVGSILLIYIGAKLGGISGAVAGNAPAMLVIITIFIGMGKLGVKNSIWLKWLIFPFCWFIVIISINFLLEAIPNSARLTLVIAGIQGFVLLFWFLNIQMKNKVLV